MFFPGEPRLLRERAGEVVPRGPPPLQQRPPHPGGNKARPPGRRRHHQQTQRKETSSNHLSTGEKTLPGFTNSILDFPCLCGARYDSSTNKVSRFEPS